MIDYENSVSKLLIITYILLFEIIKTLKFRSSLDRHLSVGDQFFGQSMRGFTKLRTDSIFNPIGLIVISVVENTKF